MLAGLAHRQTCHHLCEAWVVDNQSGFMLVGYKTLVYTAKRLRFSKVRGCTWVQAQPS